jgi:2'-5' RNA ligase
VFYGDTDNHQLDNIKRHTNQMVANGKKFTLLTTNQGFFGTVSNPKVLWIGFKEPSGELAKIQQGLTKLAMAEGILLEAKPFKMHLTLGRVNRGVTENMMKAWLNAAHAMPQLSFFVDEISVFESILTPQGPIYKPLHVFKLP